MAWLGTKCCVHIKPQSCLLWGLNALNAFHVGSAVHHYLCYQTLIPTTGVESISHIVTFQHHSMQTPHVSNKMVAITLFRSRGTELRLLTEVASVHAFNGQLMKLVLKVLCTKVYVQWYSSSVSTQPKPDLSGQLWHKWCLREHWSWSMGQS